MTDYIYSIDAKDVNKTFKGKNIEVHALKNFNIKIKQGSIQNFFFTWTKWCRKIDFY